MVKKYLQYIKESIDERIVTCNWCDWFGEESELITNDNNEEECPDCTLTEYLMDADFDDDFYEYIKNNQPEPNINKKDYKDYKDYYKDLYPPYPEYRSVKKYNL